MRETGANEVDVHFGIAINKQRVAKDEHEAKDATMRKIGNVQYDALPAAVFPVYLARVLNILVPFERRGVIMACVT